MDMLQLQYFLSIVDFNSFSAAAEENHIAQSTISKNIAALENELGVTLFDRSARQIKLTEAGVSFLNYARQFSSAYGSMLSAMKTKAQADENCITVGLHCLATHYETLPALVAFQSQHPKIEVLTRYIPSWTIQESLGRCECDFGILYDTEIDASKYTTRFLTNDQMVFVVPEDHPLARLERISISELADVPMAFTRERTQMYQIVQRECQRYGIVPKIAFKEAFPEPTLSMLKIERMGLLFLEQALLYYNLSGLKVLPLVEDIFVPLVLIRYKKSKLTAADRMLMTFLQDYYSPAGEIERSNFTRMGPGAHCCAPPPEHNG